MKAIVALLAILGAAQADITCEDCLTFGNAMQGYLMSDESITEQTELLVAYLCPTAETPRNVTKQSDSTGPALALPCTPSSLKPTLSVDRSEPARRAPTRRSWIPLVRIALVVLRLSLLSLELKQPLLKSLPSSRERDTALEPLMLLSAQWLSMP